MVMRVSFSVPPTEGLEGRAGRSPGLRVEVFFRAFPVSQWLMRNDSPLTVAGAAAGLESVTLPHRIPVSSPDLASRGTDAAGTISAPRRSGQGPPVPIR